jgi:hypothetical protein
MGDLLLSTSNFRREGFCKKKKIPFSTDVVFIGKFRQCKFNIEISRQKLAKKHALERVHMGWNNLTL